MIFSINLPLQKQKWKRLPLFQEKRLNSFLASLANELKLSQNKLETYYKKFSEYPEAGIYADTYYVPYGISEKHLMHFLLSESDKKYEEISEKIYGNYTTKKMAKYTYHCIHYTKRSSQYTRDAYCLISYLNRLKKGMPLQMDGHFNYGKYSHIKVTPERIKTDTSRFNTYKYKGLPLSPIGAVSLDAIIAAMKPAKTDYLYFMKNAQGVHDFTNSYKNHRKNIKKAR